MFKRLCTQLCLFALLFPALAFAAQNPTPAAPTRDEDVFVIPEGTEIQLSLRDPVSSKLSEPGDEVLAVVRRDVVVDGRVILQQGTEVVGRVTQRLKFLKKAFK